MKTVHDDVNKQPAQGGPGEGIVAERRGAPVFPRGLEWAVGASWRLIVVTAACIALVLGLVKLRIVVVPVFVALIAVTVLESPVRWLRRRRWSPLLATLTVFVGVAALLVGAVLLVGPSLGDQFAQVGSDLDRGVADVERWLVDGPLGLTPEQIERYVGTVVDYARTNSKSISTGVVAGTALALEAVAGALLALVLAFFFLKDGDRFTTWSTRQFAESNRATACAVGRRVWATLGSYVRGIMVVGLVDASVIGVGLVVIGVPVAVPLAVLTFLGAFFPLVGASVAGLIAALVALVTGGPGDALVVIALVVAVQQIEGHVLAPVVMGRALQLHPVVVIVALTTGAVFAGLLGAFLAVPLTAMAFAANTELRNQRTVSPDTASGPAASADSDETSPGPRTLALPFTHLIATK